MANLLDLAKNLFQQGGQKVQQAANPIMQGLNTAFNPLSGFQAGVNNTRAALNTPIGPKQISVSQAIQQTAPTVAQDFGNMFRQGIRGPSQFVQPINNTLRPVFNSVANTGQAIGGGVTDTILGLGRTFNQNANLPERLGGTLQIARGAGKIGAVGTPLFTQANLVSQLPQSQNTGLLSNPIQRFSSGITRGLSLDPSLAPEVAKRTVNTPFGPVDPISAVGGAVGFTRNPFNKKINESIGQFLPSNNKTLTSFLTSNGLRGGIENTLQQLPDLPDNLDAKGKAKWIAEQFGIGAAGQIAGEGLNIGAGKLGSAIGESKLGQYSKEQLATVFDDLKRSKNILTQTKQTMNQRFLNSALEEELKFKSLDNVQARNEVGQFGKKNKLLKASGSLNVMNEEVPLVRVKVPSVEGTTKELIVPASRFVNEPQLAQYEIEPANASARRLYKFAKQGGFVSGDINTKDRINLSEGVPIKTEGTLPAPTERTPLQQTELPTQSTSKISQQDISSSEQIIPDSQTYSDRRSLSKAQRSILSDYENGISRSSTGAVNAEPSFKTQEKLKLANEKVDAKNEALQYKEQQKQLFGEAETRSTAQAINDLARATKQTTNEAASGLESSAGWKDKSRLSYARETMERNFEDIMGADAPAMKQKYLEPIYKANGERARFLNAERSQIKELGIAPRSKESELLQLFGEKKITEDQIPLKSREKIVNAEKVLRQKYDTYLEQLNKVLERNGYDPVPKRQDYFHHFQDIEAKFNQIGVALKANDLPTDINGLSADFKPGRTFFNATLERTGDKTSVDAITGIDKYLEGFSNQLYQTDNIQRLRALENAIREKYAGTTHLSNFVADLTEYTNALAGKKSMIDRAAESVVGRGVYAAANKLKSQVGANMVGANVSSALTNFLPVTQTLATTDKASVGQALFSIVKNVFKDDGFVNASDFLTSREGADRLAMTNWEKAADKTGWLFKVIDSFTSQLAVRSKYLEGLKNGLSETEAMSQANSWGRKTLAGRSAGEMPTLFNSKTLGFLTQFQLEVNNQMSFLAKDIPRNFNKVGAASATAQLFLYSYLANNLYEQVMGRRPGLDPLGVAQQAYEDYSNPNMKKSQATKNLVGNISNQLPFASTFTGGRLPIGGAIPDLVGIAQGTADWKKEAIKPATYLLSPFGGGQIKKTIEGINAYNQGASTTSSGKVRFPIEQNLENRIKTTLFGQYSTKEAQPYFRQGDTPLSDAQSEAFKSLPNSQSGQFFNNIKQMRIANSNEDKAVSELKSQAISGGKSGTTVGDKFVYLNDKYEKESIDLGAINSMPSSTNLGKVKKDKEVWSAAEKIITSGVSEAEQSSVLQKLGISKEDAQYYATAKSSNDEKTAYVLDNTAKLEGKELYDQLVNWRKPVNGAMVLSDGVINNLVDEGMITSEQGKALKKIDYTRSGKLKVSSGSKGKKITIKAPAFKAIKLAQIKPIKAAKVKKLKFKKYKPRRIAVR